MKIAVLTQEGFEIRDVAVPQCGPKDVLVNMTGCGICSGDVFVYRTRSEAAKMPRELGHEASGIVADVGAEVTEFVKGDIVTEVDGTGGYAEYFIAPQERLARLPSSFDSLYALGEPVACCVHAGNRFGTRPGDRVAVLGCGFMGLICQQIAAYQGAEYILAVDPFAYRREMALQLGAHDACEPGAYVVNDRELGEFDVVIEAAGVQGTIDMAGDMVKQHGRIILIGYHQSNGGLRTINIQQWNFKAIDIINGHIRREWEKIDAMRQGIALMQGGHLVTEPLVTLYDLNNVTQAFEDLTAGKEGLFKAVLKNG